MSNVKEIFIQAVVPYDWMQRKSEFNPAPDALDHDDICFVASLLLGPAMGLSHSYWPTGSLPLENGGELGMYDLTIEGSEAVAWPGIERLHAIIEKRGWVVGSEVTDMEDGVGAGSAYKSPEHLVKELKARTW